jgi:hypothetical protein
VARAQFGSTASGKDSEVLQQQLIPPQQERPGDIEALVAVDRTFNPKYALERVELTSCPAPSTVETNHRLEQHADGRHPRTLPGRHHF